MTLLTKELSGPNGIAFSPDERYLYVDNWDLKRKVLMRYDVDAGRHAGARPGVLATSPGLAEPVALDGIKVDQRGNVYVSAPGGMWILSPEGKALGRIVPPGARRQLRLGRRGRQSTLPDGEHRTLPDPAQRRGGATGRHAAGGGTMSMSARALRSYGTMAVRIALLAGVLHSAPGRQVTTADAQLQPRPTHEPVIVRLDPRFDRLVPAGARLEKIVDDHGWTEGPVWVRDGGYLLFSDVVENRIYRWKEGEGERVVLERSGYTGTTPFAGPEPGSNGLAIDDQGRLVFAQHGDRRISRREADGRIVTLVERYHGKRINSPNDLVFSAARGSVLHRPAVRTAEDLRRSRQGAADPGRVSPGAGGDADAADR